MGAFEVNGPSLDVKGPLSHGVDQGRSPADETAAGQRFGGVGSHQDGLPAVDPRARRDREPRFARGFDLLGAAPRAQQDVCADDGDPDVAVWIGTGISECVRLVCRVEAASHVTSLGLVPSKVGQHVSVQAWDAEVLRSLYRGLCHPIRVIDTTQQEQQGLLPVERLDVADTRRQSRIDPEGLLDEFQPCRGSLAVSSEVGCSHQEGGPVRRVDVGQSTCRLVAQLRCPVELQAGLESVHGCEVGVSPGHGRDPSLLALVGPQFEHPQPLIAPLRRGEALPRVPCRSNPPSELLRGVLGALPVLGDLCGRRGSDPGECCGDPTVFVNRLRAPSASPDRLGEQRVPQFDIVADRGLQQPAVRELA